MKAKKMQKQKTRRELQKTISPDPTAWVIAGGCAPAGNRAISCWAAALDRSQPELSREEWNFLADILNGTWIGDDAMDSDRWSPGWLAIEVHDAQRLNGTGDRWFGEELHRGSGQAAVDALLAKIAGWQAQYEAGDIRGWLAVQYVLTAVLFFWDDAAPGRGRINHQVDEWWTIEYRTRYFAAEE